jgi:organic radical activating enzyme
VLIQSDSGDSFMSVQATSLMTAPVLEVFSSFQGEGLYAGSPQVFFRLAGCPLRCAWCDTPGSWELTEGATAKLRTASGLRQEQAQVSPAQAVEWIQEVDPSGRQTVSVTGGEPLMWTDFLLQLRPLLGRRRVHLETAGAHPESLLRVLDACDHVSADLKLPEDMGAPSAVGFTEPEASPRTPDEWRAVRRAVLKSLSGRDACSKLVVAGGRDVSAYEQIFDDQQGCAPDLALFLQPATPIAGVSAPTLATMETLRASAESRGLRTSVLGQLHRAWKLP